MSSRLLVLLLLSALLSGCLVKSLDNPVPETVSAVTETYGDVVRWGNLDKIYAFAGPGTHWKVQPNLGDVRVTDYEAGPIRKVGPGLWETTAVISYVWDDRQVVRQLIDRQVWASDDGGKTVYRKNPPPRF